MLLFSVPVVSNSLRPHGLQQARPPCPSPSPGVCPSSRSLRQWCRPAISSSDTLFSFCPQAFPESGTYPMSCLFISDDQNTGASASASVLPVNIQGWSLLRLTGLSPCCPRDFKKSFPGPRLEGFNLWCSAFFTVQLSQPYVTTAKTRALTTWAFVGRVMSLLFNTLSTFVIPFLPRGIRLWLHGCSYHPQWFWSPRRENLSLLPPSPPLFAMK